MRIERFVVFVVVNENDPKDVTVWHTRTDAQDFAARSGKVGMLIIERTVRSR